MQFEDREMKGHQVMCQDVIKNMEKDRIFTFQTLVKKVNYLTHFQSTK